MKTNNFFWKKKSQFFFSGASIKKAENPLDKVGLGQKYLNSRSKDGAIQKAIMNIFKPTFIALFHYDMKYQFQL